MNLAHLFKHLKARPLELAWAGLAAAFGVIYACSAPERGDPAMDAQQKAFIAERVAAHYASTMAGCLNGGMIAWQDPHTGASMGTFCDTQVLSRKVP